MSLGLRPFAGMMIIMGLKEEVCGGFGSGDSGIYVAGSASVRWYCGGDKFKGRGLRGFLGVEMVAVMSLGLRPFAGTVVIMGFKEEVWDYFWGSGDSGVYVAGSASVRWCCGGDGFVVF